MKSFIQSARLPLIALFTITVVGVGGPARAQTDEAEQKVEAPQQAPQVVQQCSREFAADFVNAIRLISSAAPYLDANQLPPSLPETVFSCRRFMKRYPESVTCSIPQLGRVVNTDSLKSACSALSTLYTEIGGDVALQENSGDQTPFGLLEAQALQITVEDTAAFKTLASQPMKSFAANGQILDIAGAAQAPTNVLCGVNFISALTVGLINNEAIEMQFHGTVLFEEFTSGVRVAHLLVRNNLFGFSCTKTSGGPITLGDLKNAFGPVLKIEYLQ